MKLIELKNLSESQKKAVINLWNNEYPSILGYHELAEFEAYLEKLNDKNHVLLIDHHETILAWYCDFIRDNQRWFALIIDASIQGQHKGTELLNLAKAKNSTLNAWVMDKENELKQNGEIYQSPLNFYLKNDFQLLAGTRLETETMSAVKITWNRTNYALVH